MTLGPHKCFTMHVSPKCRGDATVAPPLYLNGTLLPVITTMRILGVTFATDLCWKAHSNTVCKKMATMIGTLHRFGRTLNTDCRRKIAHAFILPHLRYCLPVWGKTSAGVQFQLNHTLLRAARVISKDRQAIFGPDSYDATRVLSLKIFLFMNNVCRLFHFINKNTASSYVGTETVEYRPNTVHSTRSARSRKLVLLLVKRKADELCFQVASIRQWNSLPHDFTLINFLVFLKIKFLLIYYRQAPIRLLCIDYINARNIHAFYLFLTIFLVILCYCV